MGKSMFDTYSCIMQFSSCCESAGSRPERDVCEIGAASKTKPLATHRVSWSSCDVSTVPPKVFPGENVTVLEGNDALLRCDVEGNPAPQVTWFAPNGAVVQNQTSGTNLTLQDVSRASHGTYNCTVKNYLGSDSGTVHLDVQCKF